MLKNLLAKLKMNSRHPIDRKIGDYVFTFISILFVLISYLWFGSFGLWNTLPTITTYYDKLATAFADGSLSLEETPDPTLLALANPYNPAERSGLRVPTDYSLYKGKYYLYFGPVPALFLTISKFLGFALLGDQYLAFTFICGIFVVQTLLIVFLWKSYFPEIPRWMATISIVFSGLTTPFIWILTQAKFYEAASTSGQFFFLVGVYFVFTGYFKENVSNKRLMMAGISWAFALGSRLIQILPIGFIGLIVVLLSIRIKRGKVVLLRSISSIIWLSTPIIIGAICIGWYNWARFGSFFETGFYYELAGPYLQKYYQQLFSPIYLLPNLYNYLFMKPGIIDRFPLLHSETGIGITKFPFLMVPPIYFTGPLTGIFYSTPFILFAGLLGFADKDKPNNIPGSKGLIGWIVIVLLGAFLLEFAPFASYFWVETRFFIDFIPPLILLAILGFWKSYLYFNNKPLLRSILVIVGFSLIAISIVESNLLALSAHRGSFKEFNPLLWKMLYKDFRPLIWKRLYEILLSNNLFFHN